MKTSGTGALCKTRMGQNVTFDGTLRPNPAIAYQLIIVKKNDFIYLLQRHCHAVAVGG